MDQDQPEIAQDSAVAGRIAGLSPAKRALLTKRLGQRSISGDALVAGCLRRHGITHVYSVSGTPIDGLLPACAHEGIRPIGVHDQRASVLMATAQNYVSGRLTAAVVVSAGPAVTNTVTGILVAYDNCWPVIVFGGRRPLQSHGTGNFQELDAVPILQTITKWSATVPSTASIPTYLEKAFQSATCGRPGPVYLDLPEEVLSGTVGTPILGEVSNALAPAVPCDEPAIQQAVDILLDAERPAMIIGKGIRWSVRLDLLRELVERLGIPFITSPMGRGFLPDDHPLCCNTARTLLQSRADAILIIGARLNWMFRYGAELAADAKLIHVDIHSEELGRNRKPAVAIRADAGQFVAQLVERIEQLTHQRDRAAQDRRESWHDELNEAKRCQALELERLAATESCPMSPMRLMKELRDFVARDAICVADGNVIMAAAQQVLPCYTPASRLDAGTNGCMGVAIPFAIGAKMARPDRQVIAIGGDFGFTLCAMELETCIRHHIPIIVVVANNHGLCGTSKHKAYYPPDYPERVTMFQPDIRYEQIAQTLGAHAEFVEHPGELRAALERAVHSARTACINVSVDPDAVFTNAWGNTR